MRETEAHGAQPRSQGSLLHFPTERERDPGCVWSRGSRTNLILREGFLSHNFVSRSRNDRKGPQEQDRFANPTTITETIANFCLNRTATR